MYHMCAVQYIARTVQEPASLDFVYVTDHGRHLLHYLVSGISENDGQLDRLYSREDVTCRATHHAQRSSLLRWLFARNLLTADIDWNAADSGCASHTHASLMHPCCSRDVATTIAVVAALSST